MATKSRRSLVLMNKGNKPFIGRRTGKVIEINARLDEHGYERVSDYFPDTDSDSENDVSIPQLRKPEPVRSQDAGKENINNSKLNISKLRKQHDNSKSRHASGKSGKKTNKSVVQKNRSECSPDSAMGSTDCGVQHVSSPTIDVIEDKLVSSPEKPVSSPDKPVSSPNEPVSSHDKQVSSPDKQVPLPGKQVSLPEKPVSLPEKPVNSSADKPVSSPDKPVSSPDKQVAVPAEQVPSTKGRTTDIPPASINYSEIMGEELSTEEENNPGSTRKKLRFSLANTSYAQEETRLDIENSLITAKQMNDQDEDEYDLISESHKDARSIAKKNTAKKLTNNTRRNDSIENVGDLLTQEVCKSNDTFLTLKKNSSHSIREQLFKTMNNDPKTITLHDTHEDPQISSSNTGVFNNPQPSQKNVYQKNKSSSKTVTLHDTSEDPQTSRSNTDVSMNPQPSPKDVYQKNKSVTQKSPDNEKMVSTNAPNTQNPPQSKIPVRKRKASRLTFGSRRVGSNRKPSPKTRKASEEISPPKAQYRKTPAGKNVLRKTGRTVLQEAEAADADDIEQQEDNPDEVDGIVEDTANTPQGESEPSYSSTNPATKKTVVKNKSNVAPELQRNKPLLGKRVAKSTKKQAVSQDDDIESEEDQPMEPKKKKTTRKGQASTKKGSKVPVSSRTVNRTRGNATRRTPIPNKDSDDIEDLDMYEDPKEASTKIPLSKYSLRKTKNTQVTGIKTPLPTQDSEDFMEEDLEFDIPGNSKEETALIQVSNPSTRKTRSKKEPDLPTHAKDDVAKNAVDGKAPSKRRGQKAKDDTNGVVDSEEHSSIKHQKETTKKKAALKTRSKKNAKEAALNQDDPGDEVPGQEHPDHESFLDILKSRFNLSAGNQSLVNSVQRSGKKTGLTTQDGLAGELEPNSEVNLESVVKASDRKAPVSRRKNLRSRKADETTEKTSTEEHDHESMVKKPNTRDDKTKLGKNTQNKRKISPNVSRESIEDESETASMVSQEFTVEPLPSASMPSPPPANFSPLSEDESFSGKVADILVTTEARSIVSRKRKLVVEISNTEYSVKKPTKAAGKAATATKTRKTNPKSQGRGKARTSQATTTKNSSQNSETSTGFSSDDEATSSTIKATGSREVFHDTIGSPVSIMSSDAESSTIKAPRNKKKKAVKLDSVSRTNVEVSENDEGPRRSHRHRVPCLQYWRNERIEYERRNSGFVVKDIIFNPTPAPIRVKRRARERAQEKARSTKRQAKKAMRSTEDESDWSDVDFSDEMTKEMDPIATVIDPETMKEVEMKLLQSGKNVMLRSPTSNGDENSNLDAPLLLDKCFSHGKFGAGEILLRPGAEKGRQHVRRDTMIFYIVSGRVLVSIHNQSFILTKGSKFFVPQGNVYNLKNLDTKKDARLFFSQIKD